LAISASTVYPTVEPNTPLSDAYQTKAREAIQKQIALGGLRLAYAIQHIFGSGNNDVESDSTTVEESTFNTDDTSSFLQ
jgi:hypothetical protein